MANHGEHPDHLEAHAVEEDGIADGGASGKHIACHLASENADAAALVIVFVIDPSPYLERDRAHLVVNGRHAGDLSVGAGVVADGADIVARNQGGNT